MHFDETLTPQVQPSPQAEVESPIDPSFETIGRGPIDLDSARQAAAQQNKVQITPEISRFCMELSNHINGASNHSWLIPDKWNPYESFGHKPELYNLLLNLRQDKDQFLSIQKAYPEQHGKTILEDIEDNFKRNGTFSSKPLHGRQALYEVEELLAVTTKQRAPLVRKILDSGSLDIVSSDAPECHAAAQRVLRRLLTKNGVGNGPNTPAIPVDDFSEIVNHYHRESKQDFAAKLMASDPILSLQLEYGMRFSTGDELDVVKYHNKVNPLQEHPDDQPIAIKTIQTFIDGANWGIDKVNHGIPKIDNLGIPDINRDIIRRENLTYVPEEEE